MEKGTELTSTQVTKVHLSNIIKSVCSRLEQTEEVDETEIETITTDEITSENEETTTSVNVQNLEEENVNMEDLETILTKMERLVNQKTLRFVKNVNYLDTKKMGLI